MTCCSRPPCCARFSRAGGAVKQNEGITEASCFSRQNLRAEQMLADGASERLWTDMMQRSETEELETGRSDG